MDNIFIIQIIQIKEDKNYSKLLKGVTNGTR